MKNYLLKKKPTIKRARKVVNNFRDQMYIYNILKIVPTLLLIPVRYIHNHWNGQ
jgi:hypothetical protein